MEDNTKKMFKLALLMLVLLMISKACSINHAGALDDAFINYSSQKILKILTIKNNKRWEKSIVYFFDTPINFVV